jgi:hypothetical protein
MQAGGLTIAADQIQSVPFAAGAMSSFEVQLIASRIKPSVEKRIQRGQRRVPLASDGSSHDVAEGSLKTRERITTSSSHDQQRKSRSKSRRTPRLKSVTSVHTESTRDDSPSLTPHTTHSDSTDPEFKENKRAVASARTVPRTRMNNAGRDVRPQSHHLTTEKQVVPPDRPRSLSRTRQMVRRLIPAILTDIRSHSISEKRQTFSENRELSSSSFASEGGASLSSQCSFRLSKKDEPFSATCTTSAAAKEVLVEAATAFPPFSHRKLRKIQKAESMRHLSMAPSAPASIPSKLEDDYHEPPSEDKSVNPPESRGVARTTSRRARSKDLRARSTHCLSVVKADPLLRQLAASGGQLSSERPEQALPRRIGSASAFKEERFGDTARSNRASKPDRLSNEFENIEDADAITDWDESTRGDDLSISQSSSARAAKLGSFLREFEKIVSDSEEESADESVYSRKGGTKTNTLQSAARERNQRRLEAIRSQRMRYEHEKSPADERIAKGPNLQPSQRQSAARQSHSKINCGIESGSLRGFQ